GGVDSAGVFAGDFYAPGRAGGSHGDRRNGECADGIQTDAGTGPCGGSLSSATAGRRLGLSGAGRGVVEGAARLWAAAGAAAGGLRSPLQRPARAAGIHAGQGRKPKRLGRAAERFVSAWVGRAAAAASDHRWLSRVGASLGDGLSASTASTLLG